MSKSYHSNLYCGNCGKIGHVYRKCLEPITSLGIIVFRKTPENKFERLNLLFSFSTFLTANFDYLK